MSNVDGDDDIYVMNVDGTGRRRLTYTHDREVNARLSPDDAYIAFWNDTPGKWDIFIVDVSGASTHQLTFNAGQNIFPAWRP